MNAAAYLAEHPEAPVWKAQPRQAVFLRAPEFEVLYGGAAGGGKTDALLVHGFIQCQKYPGAQGMFLRRTFTDLAIQGGAIPRSHELFRGHGTYSGDTHRWTFANGSSIQFGHLEHAMAHLNYRGAQLDFLLWDELTQFPEHQYLFLRSRVRPTKDGIVTTIRGATNPGDIGHAWVKKRWVEAAAWGEPFHIRVKGAEPITARFVPAKLTDNPAMLNRDPQYRSRLAELPEDLRRAYEEGDWDIYEGQFFDEWRADVHVCKPFRVPLHWTRWTATDYGYADPYCCLFYARDPETRRIYVYRELYEAGLRDEQQIDQILGTVRYRIEDRDVLENIARFGLDPSMFNKRTEQDKPSIAAVYLAALAKVYPEAAERLVPAMNNRRQGWSVVRRALAWKKDQPPRLQVFDTCRNLIRTLPAMVRDQLDPEDLADRVKGTKTEDHAVDALRYGLVLEATRAEQGPMKVKVGGR